jgi:hypothetical protein
MNITTNNQQVIIEYGDTTKIHAVNSLACEVRGDEASFFTGFNQRIYCVSLSKLSVNGTQADKANAVSLLSPLFRPFAGSSEAEAFPDAPKDGKLYARKDGSWSPVPQSDGNGGIPILRIDSDNGEDYELAEGYAKIDSSSLTDGQIFVLIAHTPSSDTDVSIHIDGVQPAPSLCYMGTGGEPCPPSDKSFLKAWHPVLTVYSSQSGFVIMN